MWRSSLAAVALAIAAAASPAHAEFCLPPVYEDGSRLLSPDETRVMWLEPLLRQHEVCWRQPARQGEARVFVYGSSGIFGYPLRADETALAEVNRSFAAGGYPAHVFNLGMLWTYVAKDALILRESERYRPDAVVYVVTLDDFFQWAPTGYAAVDSFMKSNAAAVDRAAAADLPGIDAPFEAYRRSWEADATATPAWREFRQIGSLLRASVRQVALRTRSSWFPGFAPELEAFEKPPATYDCEKVKSNFALWRSREWSLLPYLSSLQERGTRVLVVSWPVAPNPSGDCFNARYPARDFDDYNAWLGAETKRLGLPLVDLHALLPSEDFLDSIHPGEAGQKKVAEVLAVSIRKLLEKRN